MPVIRYQPAEIESAGYLLSIFGFAIPGNGVLTWGKISADDRPEMPAPRIVELYGDPFVPDELE